MKIYWHLKRNRFTEVKRNYLKLLNFRKRTRKRMNFLKYSYQNRNSLSQETIDFYEI
jgi:hypothetical protein